MREIKIPADFTFEQMVEKLKESGPGCYAHFNGVDIHSDNITLDSAAMALSGFNYSDFKKIMSELDAIKGHEAEVIDDLSKMAEKVVIPEKLEMFKTDLKDIVMDDPFNAIISKKALDIIAVLNDDLNSGVEAFNSDSFSKNKVASSVIRSLVLDYSINGADFYEITTSQELTDYKKNKIDSLRDENKLLGGENEGKRI